MDSMIRAFIRHPIDVPIELSVMGSETVDEGSSECIDAYKVHLRARNISSGGVSVMSDKYMSPNSIIQLSIPLVKPPFATFAQVVWCRAVEQCYELGVQFMHDQDEYAARMVEQVCHIEHYRKKVLHEEGRRLTAENAAQEWIAKYAHTFPSIS